MHGATEVIEYGSPGACFVGSATVTFINQHQIKEILGIGFVVAINVFSLRNRLIDREKYVGISWHHTIAFTYFFPVYFDQVFFIGVEGVNGLVGQDITVSQKQNPWPARARLVTVPACLKYLMNNLKGDEGFTGTGGQCEQNAGFALADSVCCRMNCQLLVITWLHGPF